MVPIPGMAILAHGEFGFRPCDYRIMRVQPNMRPGEIVPVRLELPRTPSATVGLTVYGANGRFAEK